MDQIILHLHQVGCLAIASIGFCCDYINFSHSINMKIMWSLSDSKAYPFVPNHDCIVNFNTVTASLAVRPPDQLIDFFSL